MLYAILLHSIESTPDFPRRLRRLRNLISASEFEMRREFLPGLAADVRRVIVDDDLDAVARFAGTQVEDEKLKNELLDAQPELTDVVFRLEDHPILRGTLSVLIVEVEGFAERAAAFERAFADPQNWLALTGALLATGDYQRLRPRSHAWQFGTSSPAHEQVWRYLLAEASREALAATRNVLGEFLDGLASSEESVARHCESVTQTWLAKRVASGYFDWRHYLVRYPSMRGGWVRDETGRDGVTGIYYGDGDQLEYSLCMLRTIQLNGYYRDPFLLELSRSSEAGAKVRDPSYTGFPSTPRWLRLDESLTGIRAVAAGFLLEAPQDAMQRATFQAVCAIHDHVEVNGQGGVLRVPQIEREGGLMDAVDRIQLGASLLRDLVKAGL